jgi:hypothetical protein
MEIFVVVAMQQPCVLVQVYHGENQSNMTTHTLSKSQKGDKSVQRLGPAVSSFCIEAQRRHGIEGWLHTRRNHPNSSKFLDCQGSQHRNVQIIVSIRHSFCNSAN